jgi:hypothetical protein
MIVASFSGITNPNALSDQMPKIIKQNCTAWEYLVSEAFPGVKFI